MHPLLQSGDRSAFQQADSWVASASIWAARLLAAFPLYRDLLQPVALAVHEMRAGLAMLVSAQKGLQTSAQDEQMGLVVAQLGASSQGLHPEGACELSACEQEVPTCMSQRSLTRSFQVAYEFTVLSFYVWLVRDHLCTALACGGCL